MQWVQFRGRDDKLAIAGALFKEFLWGDVLDIGSDVKTLQSFVGGRYIGVDISGKPDIVANLENGLPFRDKSFDCVVALDVLEHLESVHFVFDEICRVSRKFIIVGLPNMYEWRFRLGFVCGRVPGDKYGLPWEKPSDRHRWLFSLADAVQFVHDRGKHNGFSVIKETFGHYRYRRWVARMLTWVGRQLGKRGRNLFAYSYWAVLQKYEAAGDDSRFPIRRQD